METFKLRVRVGDHEFEAEGPKDAVTSQFEVWKTLIEGGRHNPQNKAPADGNAPKAVDSDFSDTNLAEIFSIDSGRGITTLRVSVSGDKPVADAVTLLLYGFRRMQGMDDVPTTKLMAALALSGPAPDRIDRHVAAYVKSGLLIQT